MEAFEPYIAHLRRVLRQAAVSPSTPAFRARITAALDGQPTEEIHRLVPPQLVRSEGAFFTGKRLARRALSAAMSTITEDSVILDPACGVGDLLIECARHLPVATGFNRTLKVWGNRLIGRDLQREFVQAAKIRLAMTALDRGVRQHESTALRVDKLFPHLKVGCGLEDEEAISRASLNRDESTVHNDGSSR